MTTAALTWTTVREQTIDRFNGQTPRPEDEAAIVDVYEQHPAMVTRAIDETATALAEGKITYAWSVLRSRLDRGSTPVREATPNTGAEKTKRIRNAEAWLHNAGLHLDREADVEDELFGERGSLRDYANDHALRARMLETWQRERPRGIAAEHEAEAWMRACAATTRRLKPTQPTNDPALDPDADIAI